MIFLLSTGAMTEGKSRDLRIPDELMEKLRLGDEAAFAQFYELTKSAVYGFALSILKSRQDAEDVMQDTYVKVYQGIGAYRNQDKPMAWVLRITRNTALNRIRSQERVVFFSRDELPDLEESVAFDAPEDRIVLREAMAVLSDQEQQILMLHAVSGLRHRELARLLELPLSTVLAKYHRALKKLRHIIKEV